MMNGEDNPAWKIHNTKNCRPKRFDKNKMADSSKKSDADYKRSRKG